MKPGDHIYRRHYSGLSTRRQILVCFPVPVPTGGCVLLLNMPYIQTCPHPAQSLCQRRFFNPSEIPVMWSQTYATHTLYWYSVGRIKNEMPCRKTGYDRYDIPLCIIGRKWKNPKGNHSHKRHTQRSTIDQFADSRSASADMERGCHA